MQPDKKLRVIWFNDFHHSIYDYLCEKLSKKNNLELGVVLGYSDDKDTSFEKIIIPKKKIFFKKFLFYYYPNLSQNNAIIDADFFVINNFSSLAALQVYWFAKKNNIKLIVAPEDKKRDDFFARIFFNLWNLFFGKRILNYASLVIPWSSDSNDFLISLGVSQNIIKKIFPAIDSSIFFKKKRKKCCSKKIISFLVVARFEDVKDHKTLLRAFKYIREEVFEDFNLSLIGRGRDSLKCEIKNLVKEYSMDRNVNFLEPVDNKKMVDVYNNHDVLILSSKKEPVGMVVLEAMACGLPVIVSDSVGSRDCVIVGENGFIFKTGDHIDLANKILTISNMNLEKMGERAINYIEINRNIEKSLDEFHNILKNL